MTPSLREESWPHSGLEKRSKTALRLTEFALAAPLGAASAPECIAGCTLTRRSHYLWLVARGARSAQSSYSHTSGLIRSPDEYEDRPLVDLHFIVLTMVRTMQNINSTIDHSLEPV